MLDDAWRAVAELAASQHGVFSRNQAAANGIDYRRLATAVRSARIVAVTPTVFVFAGHPTSARQRLAIASLALPSSIVSHRAAAFLHAFDGFEQLWLDLTVAARARAVAPLPHVTMHRAAKLPGKRDLVVIDGLLCTGVARTLVDLGAVVGRETVRRALIGQHGLGHSLNWFATTARPLLATGRNGARVLLQLLEEYQRSGVVPESWLEEVVRRIIDHPRLPRCTSQYVLRDPAGRFVARFDHAIPDARLALEAHSRRFHFGPDAEAGDEDRDLRVARQGWEIIYLGWYSQRRPEAVVDAIVDVVQQRLPRAAA